MNKRRLIGILLSTLVLIGLLGTLVSARGSIFRWPFYPFSKTTTGSTVVTKPTTGSIVTTPTTGTTVTTPTTGSTTTPTTGSSVTTPTTGSTTTTTTSSSSTVKITEVTVDAAVNCNEDEAALKPIVISPLSKGGSRIAWMGTDGKIHIATLNSADQIQGSSITLTGNDFSDMYAHDDGGAVLLTRPKASGPESLLNNPPSSPIPCYGMYLVRFDETGKELWAREVTNDKVPYTDGAIFTWWYAHHGRIAWSGSEYAAYYGTAISVSGDIHQGDRETIVSNDGAIKAGGWDWGCSHSGYERVIWDQSQKRFAGIAKTDNQNRIMYNVNGQVRGIDLWYSNVGNMVSDKKGGYWFTVSDIESGQPASTDGYADVHLIHFNVSSNGQVTTDKDIIIAGQKGLNERAPHLCTFGDKMLAGWETTSSKGDISQNDSNRKFYIQAFDLSTGQASGDSQQINIKGNRYQDLVAFPDGSAAFVSIGSSNNKIKIARISP